MPPKRHAIKGEPDFHTIGDERLDSFLDFAQQMIFAYKQCDAEKTKVLQEIWKDLSNEQLERLGNMPVVENNPVLRKAPKIRKSPAKVRL